MDHSHLLAARVKKAQANSISDFYEKVRPSPNALFLDHGLPNASNFPFKKLSITMKDGEEVTVEGPMMVNSLQYGSQEGFLPLRDQLLELTKRLHNPPGWKDLDLVIIPGSNAGLSYVFEMLLDPGDVLILTDPCYAGVFNTFQTLMPRVMTAKCDSDGVIPGELKQVLEKCKREGVGKPKVLCVNPSGSNPDGCVWSEARRRLVYDIACKYDIVILEDDPYYFLEYSEEFTPSFLSLDTESRVIRLDSFSKTVSAGWRLGYATGHKFFVDRIQFLLSNSITNTPTIVQAVVSQMLSCIGLDGYLRNLEKTKQFYRKLRNISVQAAEKHLKGLCEWEVPAGGFYLWIKVLNVEDTAKLLDRCFQKGLLFIPGQGCFHSSEPSQYIRISYARPPDMHESFRLLAEAIREEISKNESRQN